MLEKRNCGLISIGVPWFDVKYAEKILLQTFNALETEFRVIGQKGIVTDKDELKKRIEEFRKEPIDVLIIEVASFPDGELPLYLAERTSVPVIVYSLPEPDLSKAVGLNSMCGANMITSTLHNFGTPFKHVHGAPDDPAVAETLRTAVRSGAAVNVLKGQELGLVGFRAPGFYPCAFDEVLLRSKLGIGITHIGMNEMEREMGNDVRRSAPRSGYKNLEGKDVPKEAIDRLEHSYGALSEVTKKSGLSNFAIKDWPEFFDPELEGGSLWPVVGWLQEDDEVIVAPEGDVPSGVTMMIQKELGGIFPSMVDISAVRSEDSSMLLWHYGNPENLAKGEDKIRMCEWAREVQFTFKPGRATLAKLGQSRGQLRLISIAVEMMEDEVTVRRAAGYAKTLNTPVEDVVEHIIDEGWEHHVCLAYGDIETELEIFCKLNNIPYEKL